MLISALGYESNCHGRRSLPIIWEYLETKIVPFIMKLFNGVQDSSSALPQSACCIPKSVSEILKDLKQPLSKREVLIFTICDVN